MKKLIAGIALAMTIGTAQAIPAVPRAYPHPTNHYSYNTGYNHGKNDAYHNVATTLFVVGAIAIVGVVVYRLGEESRWTANDKGVVYRF